MVGKTGFGMNRQVSFLFLLKPPDMMQFQSQELVVLENCTPLETGN